MKRMMIGMVLVSLGACGGGDGPGTAAVDCSRDNGGCLADAYCAMVSGLPVCTCKPGFVGDGVTACNVLLTVSSPQDGLVIPGSAPASVLVSGTTNGAVSLEYTLDGGAPVSVSINQNAFTASISIAEEDGVQHSVEITAKDASGQSSTVVRHYFVDRVAPQISITAPGNDAECGALCTGAIINLESPSPYPLGGTIEDGGGLNSSDGLVATIDGQPIDVFLKTGAWSASWANVPAENGNEHLLALVAKDSAGNAATAKRKIYVDRVAPTCAALQNQARLISRTAVLVQCSEAMNVGAVSAAASFGDHVVTAMQSADGRGFGFANPDDLLPYTHYTMTLGTGAKDLAGNPIEAPVLQWFVTEPILPSARVSLSIGAMSYRLAVDADGLPAVIANTGTASTGQAVKAYSWNGKGNWRENAVTGYALAACSDGDPCNSYGITDFRIQAPLNGAPFPVKTYRVLIGENMGYSVWDRSSYVSSSDHFTWRKVVLPEDGVAHWKHEPSMHHDGAGTVAVLFDKEAEGDVLNAQPNYVRLNSGGTAWGSPMALLTQRYVRSGMILAKADKSFAPVIPNTMSSMGFGFSAEFLDLVFTGGNENGRSFLEGDDLRAGFLMWSEHFSSTDLSYPKVFIGCSTDRYSAPWFRSMDLSPVPQGDRNNGERPRSVMASLGESLVGLAFSTDMDRAFFGTIDLHGCQSAPINPSWDSGAVPGALSPQVAIGRNGKLWRAWIDKTTRQLVIAH